MSLFRILYTGASGLRVSQTGLATVGHNLANADTRGYSRQRVEAEAVEALLIGPRPSFMGQGTRLESVTRADDTLLEAQVRRDRTLLGFYDARSRLLDATERVFGDGGAALGARLDGFFGAARELSQRPADGALRTGLLTAASALADAFRTTDADLARLQQSVDEDLADCLDEVNDLAERVAALNAQIASAEAGGAAANDLRDQRDEALRTLGDLVDVNVMSQPDGAVRVELPGGNLLVQGDRHGTMRGAADPANGGLLAVELVDPQGAVRGVTGTLTTGELGGLLDVRDRVLGGRRAELDALAFELAAGVNAVHQAGVGLDGVGGRDLFAPLAGAAGAAGALRLDAAVAGEPDAVAAATDALLLPGDNRNALALADLQNQGRAALGGVTFGRRHAEILHAVGLDAEDNRHRQETQQVKADQSAALRESVEGVSVDDEMIDLTRYQKHFEANARVITTVDWLLDTVMALVQ